MPVKKKSNPFKRLLDNTGKSLQGLQQLSQNFFEEELDIIDVINVLEETKLNKKELGTLAKVEKQIGTALKNRFDKLITSKPKLDNPLKVKPSFDAAKKLGIVTQLAKGLTAAKIISLLGKLTVLEQYHYKKNIIILLVGNKREEKQAMSQELKALAEGMGLTFIYVHT